MAPVVIAVCFVSVAHGVSLQMPPVTSPAADPEIDGIDSNVFVDDSAGLETIADAVEENFYNNLYKIFVRNLRGEFLSVVGFVFTNNY